MFDNESWCVQVAVAADDHGKRGVSMDLVHSPTAEMEDSWAAAVAQACNDVRIEWWAQNSPKKMRAAREAAVMAAAFLLEYDGMEPSALETILRVLRWDLPRWRRLIPSIVPPQTLELVALRLRQGRISPRVLPGGKLVLVVGNMEPREAEN